MSEQNHDTRELNEEELQEANGGFAIYQPENCQNGCPWVYYKCSSCGFEQFQNISREGNKCPKCGSKMVAKEVYGTRPEGGGWAPTNIIY